MTLKIDRLRKIYPGRSKPAVDDLSLEVDDCEVLGFVGLNGAGKTTTIRIAAGVTRPSSGSVSVQGFDIVRQKAQASRYIGWVSEFPNFEPGGRCLDQLRYIAGFHELGGGVAKRRCTELLELVGLPGLERARFRTLSQGMKKRFALAAALLGDPDVLLLDEFLNGLDPEGVVFARKLILDLREGGTSVLLSSHILSEVQQVSDRVAVVHKGRLVKVLPKSDFTDASSGVLRVSIDNMDAAAVEYLRSVGEAVRVKDHTALISGPKEEPGAINLELTRRNYRVVALSFDHVSLEDLFFQLISEAGVGEPPR